MAPLAQKLGLALLLGLGSISLALSMTVLDWQHWVTPACFAFNILALLYLLN
jgi:hypothetical protein